MKNAQYRLGQLIILVAIIQSLRWAFMRTLSLVFAVALVVACEKVPTPTKHNVTVSREIREDDKLLDTATIWTMDVSSLSIYFTRSDINPQALLSGSHKLSDDIHTVTFRGTDGQNALSVFNTFSQWDATARANHVEPFSKRISSDCVFSYGAYGGSEGRLNETFTERDIAKFSELLKQLPEVNAERLAKESKAEQEQSLFKEGTAGNLKSENGVPTLPPAPPPAEMITLTQPVPIQTESGTVTLPVGTKLQFVSQLNTKAHVLYLNRDYTIQIAATDLNRQRSKTAK
jgi:hypothetical protein